MLLATLTDGHATAAIKEALRLGSGGRFDLPTGTVYPALHRLERAGLIAAAGRRSTAADGAAMRSPPPDVAPSATNDPPGRSSPPPSPPCSGQPMAGSNLSGSTSRDAVADYLAAVAAQLRAIRPGRGHR